MNTTISRLLSCAIFILFALNIVPTTLYAEDTKPAATEAGENIPELDQLLANIEHQKLYIERLQNRAETLEGDFKTILKLGIDRAWIGLLEKNLLFAEDVLKRTDEDVSGKYRQKAEKILERQASIAKTAIKGIVSHTQLPEANLSATQQAAVFARMFRLLNSLNQTYNILIKSLEASEKFGKDTTNQKNELREVLADRAATGSILLDVAANKVAELKASLSAMPDDAEIQAQQKVAKNNIKLTASSLNEVLDLMDSLGLETTEYREQLLRVTGEITSEAFNFGVITRLLKGWWQKFLDKTAENGPDILVKILLFCLIVYIARKISNVSQRLIERGITKSNLQLSELLRRMMLNTVRSVIMVLGILVALSQAGVSIGPLFAGLGVAGFVIGFALQDSLSNFASGVMILFYRPFDVGDLVETAGVSGKVSHMSLVNTTILTFDNQTIILPNNKIWGDVIRNVTAQRLRRIDMVFGISYTDDIPKAERVLQEILDNNDRVLKDPEPMVRLHELGDSSVNFIVRPWVNTDDYWDVYWETTRTVKMRFDEEGITIPFPQRDIHLYSQKSNES